MQNSKLAVLLYGFSVREWDSFEEYLASPYFNKNPDLSQLALWFRQQTKHPETGSREQAWAAVYTTEAYDSKQLNYLFSWLLQLATRFLAIEKWQQSAVQPDIYAAISLSERGLSKHFRFELDRIKKKRKSENRDATFLMEEFSVVDLERAHYSRQAARKSNPCLQEGADALDRFYFATKLKYSCAMMNDQAATASEFELTFTNEIRLFLTANPRWLNEPAIAIYYCIWRMLTQPESDADFETLKNLIMEQTNGFPVEEQAELYGYALNYAIRKIRNTQEQYVAEALRLYEAGIQNGILLNDGHLPPWHFKNIVKLGLRSGQYGWTEAFIRDKSQLLEPVFRPDALHFSLADLFFYTNDYDKAIHHLQRIAFTDIYYDLGAREMLAKVYYITGAEEALYSLIHAFRTFLRRNKVISQDTRKAYLNFLNFLEKILKSSPGQATALRTAISQAEPLVAKSWLIGALG